MTLRWFWTVGLVAVFMAAVAACGDDDDGGNDGGPGRISLTSEEFDDGGPFPADFTCDGRDHSPRLRWGARPGNAASLAIIMDDLDADFIHWVAYDMDPALGGIDFAGATEGFPGGGTDYGTNDFGQPGYAGPCPPPGDEPHTYRVRLFVLDIIPDLEPGATAEELEGVMEGHIIAQGAVTGTYGR